MTANKKIEKTNTPIKRLLAFALSLFFGTLSYWTFTGYMDTIMPFPGLANELGVFCMFSLCAFSTLMIACQD